MLIWESLLLDAIQNPSNTKISGLKLRVGNFKTCLIGENKELLERRGYKFFSGKTSFICKNIELCNIDLKFYQAIKDENLESALLIVNEFKKIVNDI